LKGSFRTVAVFTLLGPLIGSSPWVIGAYMAQREGGSMVWPLVLIFGFILGLGPSVVAAAGFLIWVRARIAKSHAKVPGLSLAFSGAAFGFTSTFALALLFGHAASALVFGLEGALAGAACGALCYPLTRPSGGLPQARAAED
jgi:hypothetical protein